MLESITKADRNTTISGTFLFALNLKSGVMTLPSLMRPSSPAMVSTTTISGRRQGRATCLQGLRHGHPVGHLPRGGGPAAGKVKVDQRVRIACKGDAKGIQCLLVPQLGCRRDRRIRWVHACCCVCELGL